MKICIYFYFQTYFKYLLKQLLHKKVSLLAYSSFKNQVYKIVLKENIEGHDIGIDNF